MPICQKCNVTFPNRTVIDGKVKTLQSRHYCLDCSPYGQHNTRQIIRQKVIFTGKICPKCSIFKQPSDFYRRRKGNDLSTYCRLCSKQEVISRFRRFKQKCVEYKGGKCEKCGYNRYVGALDFHHIDPKEKDFGINRFKKNDFSRLKKELDKCLLLCSNCHREEHARINGLI